LSSWATDGGSFGVDPFGAKDSTRIWPSSVNRTVLMLVVTTRGSDLLLACGGHRYRATRPTCSPHLSPSVLVVPSGRVSFPSATVIPTEDRNLSRVAPVPALLSFLGAMLIRPLPLVEMPVVSAPLAGRFPWKSPQMLRPNGSYHWSEVVGATLAVSRRLSLAKYTSTSPTTMMPTMRAG
jgi:hypothetical protein